MIRIKELQFLFEGELGERAKVIRVCFDHVPFIAMSGIEDVRLFLERLGRPDLMAKHLEDLAKTRQPEIDEEICLLEKFATPIMGASIQYTALGMAWYSKLSNYPVDVGLIIAFASAELEDRVRAEFKEMCQFFMNKGQEDESARLVVPD
jgi:hypothetical protein